MRPRGYMWLGVLTMLLASGMGVFITSDGMAIWLAFAGGCLFGKGYGVHEERERRG